MRYFIALEISSENKSQFQSIQQKLHTLIPQCRLTLKRNLEKIMACFFEPIPITSIKLFESVPSGSFHTHNTLAQIPLIVPIQKGNSATV